MKYLGAAFLALICSFNVEAFSSYHGKTLQAPRVQLPIQGRPQTTFDSIVNHHVNPNPIKLRVQKTTPSQLYSSASAAVDKKDSVSPIISTLSIVLMDVFLRKAFKKASISFPSSLAGCGALFATLLTLHQISPELGDGLYDKLSSGAGVLAKWLPVFFVPSLVTLPLAPSMGSTLEVSIVSNSFALKFF